MLTVMKREQVVSGKKQAQVESCMVRFQKGPTNNGTCSVLSLTRDLTGLTYVQCEAGSVYEDMLVPIPDIDRVLSILKMHREWLTVDYKPSENKVLFRSSSEERTSKKQTTLQVSDEAKAFSHSPESVLVFYEKSLGLAERIDATEQTYTDRNGNVVAPCASFTADADEIYSALRCDAIGNQRLNRFTFQFDGERNFPNVTVIVGDPMYGQTETKINTEASDSPIGTSDSAKKKPLTMDFDGGLDYLFKHKQGSCDVFFFDFTHEEQGYRFGVRFNDGSWAFQAGVL